jgi:hypothetical protein
MWMHVWSMICPKLHCVPISTIFRQTKPTLLKKLCNRFYSLRSIQCMKFGWTKARLGYLSLDSRTLNKACHACKVLSLKMWQSEPAKMFRWEVRIHYFRMSFERLKFREFCNNGINSNAHFLWQILQLWAPILSRVTHLNESETRGWSDHVHQQRTVLRDYAWVCSWSWETTQVTDCEGKRVRFLILSSQPLQNHSSNAVQCISLHTS